MLRAAHLLPLTRLAAGLPQSARDRLAATSARRALKRNSKRVERAREHISRCFPEWDSSQQQHCLAAHFDHRYRLLFDLSWLRHAPLTRITDSIASWHGFEQLESALRSRRPVIMATPHHGDWERFNLVMGTRVAAAVLYKPSTDPAIEQWLVTLRSRSGVIPLPANRRGIRQVLEHLRNGGIVGILPDQIPRSGSGVVAPFFDQPAATMTLIHQLVQKTRSLVFFGSCIRQAQGFKVSIDPAPDELYAGDAAASASAMNRAIENIVRRTPEQYLWTYRRWSTPADNPLPVKPP
ncbi:MAG: lauroyl acyltransferase [Wenzhouxiangellaceae bacterium]